jgi:hypothetical protein
MYFDTKSYLKSTRNYSIKHALSGKTLFIVTEFSQMAWFLLIIINAVEDLNFFFLGSKIGLKRSY